jgi:general secretion pathway protein M
VKQWFLRFSPREQLALLLMVAAVATWVVVVLMLQPLAAARQRLEQTNVATAEVLQRVDRMATAILAQRDSGTRPARSRNLTAVLNSSAEAAGLTITRLQPNSRGAVQLRMESAPFAELLRWLHALEHDDGLLIEELSLSQSGIGGAVSVSLRVSQAP